MEDNKSFENELRKLLTEHDREITEKVLYRVLGKLYFQDYNRQCDYDKMTGAEVVKAQHKVLAEIEKEFNYKLEDEFLQLPF